MNNFKAYFLLTVVTLFMLLLGDLIGGHSGILVAALIALLMNINAYFYSDVIVLRLYHAKKMDDVNLPVQSMVKTLADKAGLPVPALYLIENDVPNAFAVGRNPKKASIAVTSGLLTVLNPNELTAVLAYEMAHILHQDTFVGGAIATVAGGITGVADKSVWASVFGMHVKNKKPHLNDIVMMFVGPIAALLVRLAIARSREFEADTTGAALCGNPLWLISALEKIEAAKSKDVFVLAEIRPGTAHLFVVNPLHAKLTALFVTHPTTEARVRRLKEGPVSVHSVA